MHGELTDEQRRLAAAGDLNVLALLMLVGSTRRLRLGLGAARCGVYLAFSVLGLEIIERAHATGVVDSNSPD